MTEFPTRYWHPESSSRRIRPPHLGDFLYKTADLITYFTTVCVGVHVSPKFLAKLRTRMGNLGKSNGHSRGSRRAQKGNSEAGPHLKAGGIPTRDWHPESSSRRIRPPHLGDFLKKTADLIIFFYDSLRRCPCVTRIFGQFAEPE